MSKLAVVLLAKELDRRHRADGIISVSLHPGIVGASAAPTYALTHKRANWRATCP